MIFIHIPRQQVMRHKKLSCKYLIIHSPQLLASWPCPLPNRRSKGCESGKNVTIFCHGGSNTTCITHQSADRIKANKRNKFTLDVTSYGECRIQTYNTRQYHFTLRTDSGKKVSVTAFGMDRITGPVAKLNTSALAKLFPSYDPESPQRKTNQVDIPLGHDYFGLFPKYEETKCGENLSIMGGGGI